ncbi:MAG: aminoglycoside phosphotransferase family protein [Hyphomicrobiales bacterium]|nr:aminoglycoside phosphotransferase family protein [Hyphomicrobiales bacterium]
MTDPSKAGALRRFGVDPGQLIGAGSESEVYALDDHRVLRIPRGRGPDNGALARRQRFLDDLVGRLPFDTPQIEAIEPDGATIEKRLVGQPMNDVLKAVAGEDRQRALTSYFNAATAFRAIKLPGARYGNLLAEEPLLADRWTEFLSTSLTRRVAQHRAHLADAFGDVDTLAGQAFDLLSLVPEQPEAVLAHGDFFPGNVLIDSQMNVAGVLDFGNWTLCAEPLYDLAGAVMFAEMTTECRPEDWRMLRALLASHCGGQPPAAMAFYRAYFAFTLFDPNGTASLYPRLHPWNVSTLTQLRDGSITDWIRTSR